MPLGSSGCEATARTGVCRGHRGRTFALVLLERRT